MQDELTKCGAKHAELIWVDGAHSDMSTKPFNVERLEWMLRQKRGGGGGDNDNASTPPAYDRGDEEEKENQEEGKKGNDDNDNKGDDKKGDDKKKNDDDGEDSPSVEVELSPSADGKDSTSHKQLNTDLEEGESKTDDSTASPGNIPYADDDSTSTPSASSGKCRRVKRKRSAK